MADTLTTRTRTSGTNTLKLLVSNDMTTGSDETAAVKVDLSALPNAPARIGIREVQYDCNGVLVKLGFDATAKEYPLLLSGRGRMRFDPPLKALDAGGTGDVILSTTGAAAGDSYTIDLDLSLA